jgi:hypothetical protein
MLGPANGAEAATLFVNWVQSPDGGWSFYLKDDAPPRITHHLTELFRLIRLLTCEQSDNAESDKCRVIEQNSCPIKSHLLYVI